MTYLPKDFIETAEGLLFAVVDQHIEQDKALCFLRYVHQNDRWLKKTTDEANAFLIRHCPAYLHYSERLDARLHAVPRQRIMRHHRPRDRLDRILRDKRHDVVERDVSILARLLRERGIDLTRVGVTGSLLVGVQRNSSDIDLVCYGRDVFHRCRAMVRELIEEGCLEPLHEAGWQESYLRRDCSLSFDDYVRHERRKCNKALVNGRKFDLSLVEQWGAAKETGYQKIGPITLLCRVIDDTHVFDYPAIYRIEHDNIDRVLCFTATYTGQAFKGERIEVSGILEQNEQGFRQIVVGSSREAHGEHIKVIDN